MKQEELEKVLFDLGSTSEEVYQKLKDKGIKGLPCRSTACPVSAYLKSILGREICVGSSTVGFASFSPEEESYVCNVPIPVKHFIFAFDSGYKFQDLHADKEHDPFCKK